MKFNNTKSLQQFILLGILILFSLVMALLSEDFFTVTNITNLIRQQSMVAIAAAGATFIMITCGLDISVGSTLALSGVVFALLVQGGIPILLAAILAVVSGGIIGSLNAAMIVGAKINPVIATLGTMYAVRGIAYLLADGQAVVNGLPLEFMNLGRGYIGFLPIPVLILLIIYVVFGFILSKTLLGKYTYAIGGNIETARLSGIPVKKVMFSLYVIVGLLTGLSGVIMASRLNSGNPQIGQGFEFDVIIAVFLGGVSVKGGEGSLTGTLIGTMIVGVLSNGLNLLGVNAFYQYIIKGVVLVLAVMVDMTLKGNGINFKGLLKNVQRGGSVNG
ncbi:ABC transporter permease [Paenibacillus sp. KQZ6P-2]|uniref:ABC transporter permease n=1 Tax=Paenibacillus mangrovi TaxID=2931978 RepID=A0A9X1WQS2_9BACL|nr:ABC transporter permease [Paenibacillus mangrovi]MCJ8013602.1 ABC transporter permease [Paenibacillus mangrovi]